MGIAGDSALEARGWKINAKRVYRLYDEENLKVRSVSEENSAPPESTPSAGVGPNQALVGGFR